MTGVSSSGVGRHAEIASFLRSRRERLAPADVGLNAGRRRRVRGLRREEVARLADVGVTWYTWLEQGRPIVVSAAILQRIAAALLLDTSETQYLRRLVRPSTRRRPADSAHVDVATRYVVERFSDGYAYLRNARFDWLAWNERFGRLQRLDERATGMDRNALWRLFMHENMRTLVPSWDEYARRLVAAFRAEYAQYVGDPQFEQLIEALGCASSEFAALWAGGDVLAPSQWVSVGPMDMRDPDTREVQPLKFDPLHLAPRESPGQITVFAIT